MKNILIFRYTLNYLFENPHEFFLINVVKKENYIVGINFGVLCIF